MWIVRPFCVKALEAIGISQCDIVGQVGSYIQKCHIHLLKVGSYAKFNINAMWWYEAQVVAIFCHA
jgi:hypothetical protein